MPLQIINGPIIRAGESVSDPIDTGEEGSMVRLTMPGHWGGGAAPLTFQISSDGELFNDLYDHQGHEITIPVSIGAGVIFPLGMMAGIRFIRFRSGTSAAPVPQEIEREFAVAVMVDAVQTPPAATAKAHRKTPRKSGARRKK